MPFLDRQSIIILLIGPIFLIIYFVVNIKADPYRKQFQIPYDGSDTLDVNKYLSSTNASALDFIPWTKFYFDTTDTISFDRIQDKAFIDHEGFFTSKGTWKKLPYCPRPIERFQKLPFRWDSVILLTFQGYLRRWRNAHPCNIERRLDGIVNRNSVANSFHFYVN